MFFSKKCMFFVVCTVVTVFSFGVYADGVRAEKPVVGVVSVSEKGAQFSITLPEIRHNKMTNEKGVVFDRFDFEGCGVWASGEGAPELPVYRTLIEVPDGVTVTATFGKAPSERLSGKYLLWPSQPPEQETATPPLDLRSAFCFDAKAYEKEDAGFDGWGRVSDAGYMRGHRLQWLEIFPVRYSPSQKSVSLLKGTMSVSLSYSGAVKRKARMSALSNPDWDRFVDAVSIQACVETKVDRAAYATKTMSFSGADYLIIVPDALEAAVAPLAEWKHRKGLRVKVTPLSDIGVNPDTAAIKAYVQNAYDTWNPAPSYLLLIGSPRTDLPNFIYDYDYDYYSDHGYALLDGIDLYPEIFVGRISYPNLSAARLQGAIDKILTYELDPDLSSGDSSMYNHCLLGAYYQDKDDDGYADRYFMETTVHQKEFLESTIGLAVTPAWYTNSGTHNEYHYRLDGTYTGRPGSPGALVPSSVTSLWNRSYWNIDILIRWAFSCGIDLVIYEGHGKSTGWGSIGYVKSNLAQLNNCGEYPSVFSLACNVGRFGLTTSNASFSEEIQTMEGNGAVWTLAGSCDTRTPHNELMGSGILDYFFDAYLPAISSGSCVNSKRPAEATNYGKLYLGSIYPTLATAMTWRAFNIFGDPEMQMRLNERSHGCTLYTDFSSQASSYTAHLWLYTSDGTPISGQKIVLSEPEDLASATQEQTTSSTGTASFSGLPMDYVYDVAVFNTNLAPWNRVLAHTADTEGFDCTISVAERERVLSYRNSNAYHIDYTSIDGYAAGSGATSSYFAHASDYHPNHTPDWTIDLTELLRIIQFSNSDGYTFSFGTEDNFAPAQPRSKAMLSDPVLSSYTTIEAGAARAQEADCATVSVELVESLPGNSDITALGLVADLPKGYVYDGWVAGPKPAAESQKGAVGSLEFAWSEVPTLPCTVQYRIRSVASVKLQANAVPAHRFLYRTYGAELQSKEAAVPLKAVQ